MTKSKYFFLIVGPAGSVFYLFIYPGLVATNTLEINAFNIAFAGFMFLQLWMLIAELAFEAAAEIYDLKRKYLFPFLRSIDKDCKKPELRFKNRFVVIGIVLFSYIFSVYAFGILYIFISYLDENSFSSAPLEYIDGIYFSFITATTVGYGDITPNSALSKVLVMTEVLISLLYVVVLFSSAAAFARESKSQ